MMGIVPALVISAVIYGRYTKRLSKLYQDALAKASDVGTECISNARIMKSFAAETLSNKQYSESIEASYRLGAQRVMGYGGFVGGLGGMANFAIIVVVYYGSVLVIDGEMSVASLTSFVLYTVYIAVGMGLLGNLYTDLMNAVGASERCNSFD
jgi:ABC-type multidrug transport system fused ATPase/permease subunit